jgi:hypothetical protein
MPTSIGSFRVTQPRASPQASESHNSEPAPLPSHTTLPSHTAARQHPFRVTELPASTSLTEPPAPSRAATEPGGPRRRSARCGALAAVTARRPSPGAGQVRETEPPPWAPPRRLAGLGAASSVLVSASESVAECFPKLERAPARPRRHRRAGARARLAERPAPGPGLPMHYLVLPVTRANSRHSEALAGTLEAAPSPASRGLAPTAEAPSLAPARRLARAASPSLRRGRRTARIACAGRLARLPRGRRFREAGAGGQFCDSEGVLAGNFVTRKGCWRAVV